MLDAVGLSLDPNEKAKVKEVSPGSSAERDGYKPNDEILKLGGQPPLNRRCPMGASWRSQPRHREGGNPRGAKKIELDLTLGEAGEQEPIFPGE